MEASDPSRGSPLTPQGVGTTRNASVAETTTKLALIFKEMDVSKNANTMRGSKRCLIGRVDGGFEPGGCGLARSSASTCSLAVGLRMDED